MKNIFTLLKTDHRKVQAKLKELTNTKENSPLKREKLLSEIKKELTVHNKAEEKVFYSRLNADRDERVMIYEGKDEHHLGGQILKELDAMDKGTEAWAARAKVLKDLIDHHVEEEEGKVHSEAKKEFSKEDSREVGEEFVAFKEKLLANYR